MDDSPARLPVVAATHRYEQVKECFPSASNHDDYEEDLELLFTKELGSCGNECVFFVI